MSDTPRTDAAWPGHKSCDIEFARQLEREVERLRICLNRRDEEMQHQARLAMAARAERDEAKADAISQGLALCEERDAWRALADALADELEDNLPPGLPSAALDRLTAAKCQNHLKFNPVAQPSAYDPTTRLSRRLDRHP